MAHALFTTSCSPSPCPLAAILAMVHAPSSYDKVSHVPATPSPMPCPCPCPVHAHALSMPAPCPCLHPVYARILSMPAPCPCPHPVHARTLSMPTPLLCTSWVSHSQNQVVSGNACIEKNSGNSMWVMFTTMGRSYCRSAGGPECGGRGHWWPVTTSSEH